MNMTYDCFIVVFDTLGHLALEPVVPVLNTLSRDIEESKRLLIEEYPNEFNHQGISWQEKEEQGYRIVKCTLSIDL